MSNIAIKVTDLSKLYKLGKEKSGRLIDSFKSIISRKDVAQKDFWALKDVSFEINRGDAVAIIGKNGAGKSTMLKILSRITDPTKGRIEINGRVSSLLEVGTGFHPELSGRENIYLNGTILGMSRGEIKKKFDEIVDFSGVEQFLDTPVKHYSSGMYVRLAFSVAAHLEPDILIIDEVLAVGDAEFQKKCLGKMDEVSKGQGRTVIFVSHNMSSIVSLCKKGILLKNGSVMCSGPVQSVIDEYENDYKSGNQKISEITKREGDGAIKFTDVKFLDWSGVERTDFTVGQPLEIRVYFEASDIFKLSRTSRIDVDINDVLNNRIVWLSTSVYSGKISPDKNYVSFRLNKILLAEGTYNLSLYSQTDLGISDYIANVSRLNIVYNDFYGTGIMVPQKRLCVVTEFTVN